MKTVGIIMECNPFHEGHKYVIEKARKESCADYCVVVLSGDHVQRGEPSVISKEKRTRTLLENGADLCIELPLCYAAGSAEYFAKGSVSLLSSLGVITDQAFGSESGDLDFLLESARFLSDETDEFSSLLREHLKSGCSYPLARSLAASQCGISIPASSNDLLSAEYLRAWHNEARSENIAFHAVKRIDTKGATAIRKQMIIKKAPGAVSCDDYSEALFTRLNDIFSKADPSMRNKELCTSALMSYQDVSRNLACRIFSLYPSFVNWSSFCTELKTKENTYSRISRSLLHILLDITSSDVREYIDSGIIGYARVLGFRKDASALLNEISRKSRIPLITGIPAGRSMLSYPFDRMFDADIRASQFYDHIFNIKNAAPGNCSAVSEAGKKLIKY